MDNLIVSYLILTGECPLPGVGKLYISQGNAVCDLASKELLPPQNNIHFDESTSGDTSSLINYISLNSGLPADESSGRFKLWAENIRKHLNEEAEAALPFLGKLVKDANGTVIFKSEQSLAALNAVKAERVIHESASHEVIVGDKISSSDEMHQLLSDSPNVVKDRFWLYVIIISAAAVLIIILYFILNGLGLHVNLSDAPATYFIQ